MNKIIDWLNKNYGLPDCCERSMCNGAPINYFWVLIKGCQPLKRRSHYIRLCSTHKNEYELMDERQYLESGKHSSKLSDQKVINLRLKYVSGERTQKQLAKDYKVSQPTINSAISRKTWKHLPI